MRRDLRAIEAPDKVDRLHTQLVDEVTDFRGALLHTLTSPRDGVVLSMRSRAAVEPGDSIALVFSLA